MSYYIHKTPTPYIFIHIPKTAGRSITNALSSKYDIELIPNKDTKTDNYHSTIHHARQLVDTSKYHVFSIVRNPYDRVCSYFNFRKRKIETGKIGTVEEIEATKKGIDYWFDAYSNNNWEGTWFGCYNNQTEWIDETVQVIRFEDIKYINSMPLFANIDMPKTKYNKSDNHKLHYHSIISSKLRNRINHVYEKDFDMFKYQW